MDIRTDKQDRDRLGRVIPVVDRCGVVAGEGEMDFAPVEPFDEKTEQLTVEPFDEPPLRRGVSIVSRVVGSLHVNEHVVERLECADGWVAATATYLGVPLVTHNGPHFEGVPGLTILCEPD